jgi:hypothetical protein
MKYFFCILVIGLFSCSNEEHVIQNNDAKEVSDYFKKNALRDSIQVKHFEVKVEENDQLQVIRIFWEIEEYNHTEFILEYNTMLLRGIKPMILERMDSVILEVQMINSEFGLKRYRASKAEMRNLIKEYDSIDSIYTPILKYVMRTNSIQVIDHFDEIYGYARDLQYAQIDTSAFEETGFLGYLKNDLLVENTDSLKEAAKMNLFRMIFGESTYFFNSKKAFDLVNLILELKHELTIATPWEDRFVDGEWQQKDSLK